MVNSKEVVTDSTEYVSKIKDYSSFQLVFSDLRYSFPEELLARVTFTKILSELRNSECLLRSCLECNSFFFIKLYDEQ